MAKIKIFISSVQTEFASERLALNDYILADPLLGRFFEPFLFELLPAQDQRADEVYLREVELCDIYLGIFGKNYGSIYDNGISPTESEFDKATILHKVRLVYLTSHNNSERDDMQNQLISKAQSVLVRRRFNTIDELKSIVYASLVNYLLEKEIIRIGPFDATICEKATLSDIDHNKLISFIEVASNKRGFPFSKYDNIEKILTHLNLIENNKVSNAAILLFGYKPQKFFINSEIRCAHFHGVDIEKPIPSYQVYKGDVFELVDQSVDFVLSKIDYSIGTRSQEISIPRKYEIPKEIIVEAIVNAVAHRDYTLKGSVQVMLFKDRLEITNPGSLPLGWTQEKLKRPHTSVPFNPLLAEPMYLKGYIERMGTGTSDMLRLAKEYKLKEPIFSQTEEFKVIVYRPTLVPSISNDKSSTIQVPYKYHTSETENINISVEVIQLLKILSKNEFSRKELQNKLNLKNRSNFIKVYLIPATKNKLVTMKYLDSIHHPRQKYLLTEKGKQLLRNILKK